MATMQAQIWKSSNFTIELVPAAAPQTAAFRFTGPFTARDMFQKLTPAEMRQLLDPASSDQHTVQVLDLTDVPYMDSAGLGLIVSHYVRCQAKGVKLVLAGVGPKVLHLFRLTNMHQLIPTAAEVEDAVSA
jgi:anti-anti-sigma factor